MNRHTYSQQNGFEYLMNVNNSNDTYMNDTVQNGDVSSGIGLINIHTLPQDSELSTLNEVNMSVENGDINGDYFYMNGSTGSESKNHDSIDYKNKKMKF